MIVIWSAFVVVWSLVIWRLGYMDGLDKGRRRQPTRRQELRRAREFVEAFPVHPGSDPGAVIDARGKRIARWPLGDIEILGCPRCYSPRVDGDPEGACGCSDCGLLFWDTNGVDLAVLGL